MKNIKLFSTDSLRVEYEDSENYIEPYVSYVVEDNTVHYNNPKETKLVVYYDIQDISSPTTIFNNYDKSVKSIEVDGVLLDSVVTTYQFNSIGEHIIKYEFNDPTKIGGGTAPLFSQLTTVKQIIIADTFTSIGDNAFNGCFLTSITIPNSITSIGNNAFNGCKSLTSVIIGSGVTTIGTYAFQLCNSLTTITSLLMTAPSVGAGTFYEVHSGGTLYAPIGSSGYDTWMNNQGNLGKYNWTKVEQ